MPDVGNSNYNTTKTVYTYIGSPTFSSSGSRKDESTSYRSYVWWPRIDKDIEEITKCCEGCVQTQSNPWKVPIHPWEWPSKPWQRIHIDFAGPLLEKQFLIIVDAHSKWPEIFPMNKITSTKTIEILRMVFARNGQSNLFRTTDHSLRQRSSRILWAAKASHTSDQRLTIQQQMV